MLDTVDYGYCCDMDHRNYYGDRDDVHGDDDGGDDTKNCNASTNSHNYANMDDNNRILDNTNNGMNMKDIHTN